MTNNIQSSAPALAAPVAAPSSNEISPYVIIEMAILNSIDAGQDAIDLGVTREQVLKDAFNGQKKVVQDQEQILRNLTEESSKDSKDSSVTADKMQEDLHNLQAQVVRMQAEQSKLSIDQKLMVQEMKMGPGTAQQAMQMNEQMFGSVVESHVLTERTS